MFEILYLENLSLSPSLSLTNFNLDTLQNPEDLSI